MLHVCHEGCDHTGVRCQKCGAEVGRDGVCQSCGWNGLEFTRPAATGTGSGEAKGGDRSLCANCGVLIIFGGTDPLYRHKHWVHVERENENDEREYVNCAVPDNPHYLVAVPTPPASPTVTLTFEVPALADTLARHLHDYFIVHRAFGGERLSENELMVMLLTLLRAAEQKVSFGFRPIANRDSSEVPTHRREENMMDWIKCSEWLPERGVEVNTKSDDEHGCRNEQALKRMGNLWFFPDGSMYVYYTPTHWRPLSEQPVKAEAPTGKGPTSNPSQP